MQIWLGFFFAFTDRLLERTCAVAPIDLNGKHLLDLAFGERHNLVIYSVPGRNLTTASTDCYKRDLSSCELLASALWQVLSLSAEGEVAGVCFSTAGQKSSTKLSLMEKWPCCLQGNFSVNGCCQWRFFGFLSKNNHGFWPKHLGVCLLKVTGKLSFQPNPKTFQENFQPKMKIFFSFLSNLGESDLFLMSSLSPYLDPGNKNSKATFSLFGVKQLGDREDEFSPFPREDLSTHPQHVPTLSL